MNRGQLAFLVLVNAMVSLVIALTVVWGFEARRPDPELLAAISTPRVEPVLALAPTPLPVVNAPTDGAAPTEGEAAPIQSESTPTPADAAPEEVYVVQPGDTLLVIATRYSLTVDDLLRANNLNNPDFVFAGQRLIIPVQGGAASPGTAPVATPAPAQGIQVASIAGVGDLVNELVVVINESDAPVSLQGWRLERTGGVAYTFRSDVPLFPGGSVRVHSAAGTDSSIDFYWGLTEPVWQSGVEARLLNSQGNVANSYTVP